MFQKTIVTEATNLALEFDELMWKARNLLSQDCYVVC